MSAAAIARDGEPPRACTTAAAVRRNAVDPALELIAIGDAELVLLRELATLRLRRERLAQQIAGFCGTAAERLDHGERHRSYQAVPGVVSEVPNMKLVGRRINAALLVLKDSARRREHDTARENLHALFETFGAQLFEDPCASVVGKKRLLSLKGEYDAWKAAQP